MKKVLKIILIVILCIVASFTMLFSCYRPTTLSVNAQEVVSYNYNAYVITQASNDDYDFIDNEPVLVNRRFSFPIGQFNNYFPNDITYTIGTLNYSVGTYNYQLNVKVDVFTAQVFKVYLTTLDDSFTYLLGKYTYTGTSGYYWDFDYLYTPTQIGGFVSFANDEVFSLNPVNDNQPNILNVDDLFSFQFSLDSYALHTSDMHNYIVLALSNDTQAYYNLGLNDGIAQGENNVINNPRSYDLYNESQYQAYGNSKFNEGSSSNLTTNGFRVLMSTIFNAPYQILQPILNFELLGVNLWALFSFIISIFLIIFIIRLIRGRGDS